MMEEELITIWKSSPNQERIKFEKSRLMIDVQLSMDQFHRKIRIRDSTEMVGAFIVIPVFAIYAYRVPYMISKVASVLIMLWGIFVLIRLRNARRLKPSPFTETYREYLQKTKEYLLVQKNLIDSILYWYLLPVFVLANLFMIGFIGVSWKFNWMIKTEALGIFTSVAVYVLNKRAVKKQYLPRLEKIDELIAAMEVG